MGRPKGGIMKALMAIKTYLEKDSVQGRIPLSEFKKFLETCTEKEREEFAKVAAKELGVELTT